jgi:hypothetical protein
MVYLDGDNNLDSYSAEDVQEMMTVGSSDRFNVVVLWDRYDQPAYLYKVLPNGLQVLSGMTVNGADVNDQEVGMGDPRVLAAFVDYGVAMMPADHYLVVIWDHGSPFYGACWDSHVGPGYSGGSLQFSLMAQALSGHSIDILAFDACTIGMAEIAYKFATTTDLHISYLVASEEYIPNYGYPYDRILHEMSSMSDLDEPASVAKIMAMEYAASYSPQGGAKGGMTANLSVIRVAAAPGLVDAIRDLTSVLNAKLQARFDKYHDLISGARGEANLPWDMAGTIHFVDLGTFAVELADLAKDNDMKAAATAVAQRVTEDVVLYVGNTPAMASAGALGIGIWFPPSYRSCFDANLGSSVLTQWYPTEFNFGADAGWLNFLYTYWHKAAPT